MPTHCQQGLVTCDHMLSNSQVTASGFRRHAYDSRWILLGGKISRIGIVSRQRGRINNGDVHTPIGVITVYMRMRKRSHALQ